VGGWLKICYKNGKVCIALTGEKPGARGRKGGRPRKMDQATLKLAMKALEDKSITVQEVAKKLNMTTTTLYMYLNGDGSLKEPGYKVMKG
jgi:hypothetical protein